MQKSRFMEEVIKLGETLLDDYHRLDEALANQRFLEHDEEISIKQDLEILISKVKAFNIDADHFIDSLQENAKARVLLREKRRHEYANDYEIGSPLLHEFCSYGMTIEQIMNEFKKLAVGNTRARKREDGRFHYISPERILYRGNTEMKIVSREMKRESLVELAFEKAPEWVTAEEIEERRTEKTRYDDDLNNPYDWMRKACNTLNKETRTKFGIDYDLFEKTSARIRLNPKAI